MWYNYTASFLIGGEYVSDRIKDVCKNREAYHNYFVEEKYEAGIELFGTEVKSIRSGKVNFKDSYISIDKGEAYVVGMHISPYEKGNIFNKDPLRKRKLLLHKREILKLFQNNQKDGYAIIPLKLYLKGSYVKLEIATAKGKKLHDKRDSIAQKDATRDIQRAMKERQR